MFGYGLVLFQCELTLFYLFFTVEGGKVHIRDWRTQVTQTYPKRKSQVSGALKTRLCWFHTHHPDGCPLSSKDCVFAHGADDIRPSTRPLKKHRSWPWSMQRTFVCLYLNWNSMKTCSHFDLTFGLTRNSALI